MESELYDPIGYGTLLRTVFTKERGRWRYRFAPLMISPSGRLLVVRVVCEHWVPTTRAWEEVETWKDLYRRCPNGDVGYAGSRYTLSRSLDPWHGTTSPTWADLDSRKRDTALIKTLRPIRQTADTPRLHMRGRTR